MSSEQFNLDESAQEDLLTEAADLYRDDRIEYDRNRKSLAEKLGCRTSTLDMMVSKMQPTVRDDSGSNEILLREPEPWSEPIDGAELLNELHKTFKRYVALPDGAGEALSLWVLHTYTLPAAWISPILTILSPQKRCGKSTLLSLLLYLVYRPLPVSNISPAALFRIIESHEPSLLIDELDSFHQGNEELRGILNSGHSRNLAFVLRCDSDSHEPQRFSTWGAKALALIGKPPDTIFDRSITVSMRRKKPDEKVERLKMNGENLFNDLTNKCARWAEDNVERLKGANPETPKGLNDRAADNWTPLLAIADLAGGSWPERSRKVALLLSGNELEDDSAAVQLLMDIKSLFKESGSKRLMSSYIVDKLADMEERPWPEWRKGKPITAKQLAGLLKPFEIKPGQFKDDVGKKQRGYEYKAFNDAFARYLPLPSGTAGTNLNINDLDEIRCGTEGDVVPDHNICNSFNNNMVPLVPDQTEGSGEEMYIDANSQEVMEL